MQLKGFDHGGQVKSCRVAWERAGGVAAMKEIATRLGIPADACTFYFDKQVRGNNVREPQLRMVDERRGMKFRVKPEHADSGCVMEGWLSWKGMDAAGIQRAEEAWERTEPQEKTANGAEIAAAVADKASNGVAPPAVAVAPPVKVDPTLAVIKGVSHVKSIAEATQMIRTIEEQETKLLNERSVIDQQLTKCAEEKRRIVAQMSTDALYDAIQAIDQLKAQVK